MKNPPSPVNSPHVSSRLPLAGPGAWRHASPTGPASAPAKRLGHHLCVLLLFFLCPCLASAVSVVASKHNLSASGPGTFKASTEPEICIFCHTPHGGNKAAPLWNRNSSGQTYLPYTSSTAKASPGQPTGSSKLCLSCHDGTVALGMVLSRSSAITMRAGATQLSSGPSLLGTDLRDDHPVSFTYDAALVSANGQLKSPAALPSAVKLDANSQMQCTSCHDAHNDQFGKFLVLNNTGAALCSSCHSMTSWNTTSHATALKTWNGVGTNPWPHTTGTTVQSNACENCHRPHSAGNKARLENFAGEEANCYSCHNGNVAAKNIQVEFNKASVHPIATTTGVHDPVEDPVNSTRHVECEDCHNPHASNASTAAAPAASGDLAGVMGINSAGIRVSPVVNQYELCYRCHGDSTNRGPARIARVTVQTNARLEFQNTNASFHPVAAVGKSLTVPSLIAPLTVNSRIYCTDCHSNNTGPGAGGTGPAGPHGSTFTPLLERRMDTGDRVTESATIYALCYKCHNRTVILAGTGFRYHETHLTSGGRTSCTTCHDSHGVAGSTHLINFNTAYVTKSIRLNSGPTYKDNGNGRGSCTLTCHGTDHDNWTY